MQIPTYDPRWMFPVNVSHALAQAPALVQAESLQETPTCVGTLPRRPRAGREGVGGWGEGGGLHPMPPR